MISFLIRFPPPSAPPPRLPLPNTGDFPSAAVSGRALLYQYFVLLRFHRAGAGTSAAEGELRTGCEGQVRGGKAASSRPGPARPGPARPRPAALPRRGADHPPARPPARPVLRCWASGTPFSATSSALRVFLVFCFRQVLSGRGVRGGVRDFFFFSPLLLLLPPATAALQPGEIRRPRIR